MEKVSYVLRWIFTYLLYPGLVLTIFGCIVATLVGIVAGGKGLGVVRRLTGALLPVAILIFVVIFSDANNEPITRFILWLPVLAHLVIGAVIGIAIVEIGRAISDTDVESSAYALFLSSLGVFVLYSIMQGILGHLNYFLFGLVVMGGLDVIFRD